MLQMSMAALPISKSGTKHAAPIIKSLSGETIWLNEWWRRLASVDDEACIIVCIQLLVTCARSVTSTYGGVSGIFRHQKMGTKRNQLVSTHGEV